MYDIIFSAMSGEVGVHGDIPGQHTEAEPAKNLSPSELRDERPWQHELHRRIAEIPDIPELSLADREYIRDNEGNIIDARFHQEGNEATLKEVLPGTYRFEQTHYSRAECDEDPFLLGNYFFRTHTVTFNHFDNPAPSEQSEVNTTLVHEAGHALDEEHTKKISQENEKGRLRNIFILMPIYMKELDVREGTAESQRLAPNLRKYLEENAIIPPHDLGELLRWFDDTQIVLSQPQTNESLKAYEEAQKKRIYELEDISEWEREVTAWGYAIDAIATLRKKGINIYAGTSEDLFEAINNEYTKRFTSSIKKSDAIL